MDDAPFRTNSPPVVYETVEGETIAVNLDTGTYYDLNVMGGYIFGLFEGGATGTDVVARLATTLDVDRATVDRAVESFIGLLAEERLIVPAGSRSGAPALPEGIEPPAEYADPILNKHVDMQELLLLDPVHEVGDTGWPSRA